MPAHRLPFDLFRAPTEILDPGDAGSIVVDRSPCYVGLVSAGAETRTLARPTRSGSFLILHMRTDGGDITLTVTGGFNEDGDTSFTFSDAGQFLALFSAFDGTNYYWRKFSDYGLGNIAPADADVLDLFSGLTATVSEINQHCDESANTETVAATNVITAAESGKTFFLSSATEFVSTLPAPAAGLRFTFVIAAAPSGADYTIVTNGSSNIILGNVVTSQDAGGSSDSEQTGGDTISFVSAKSVVGDRVDLVCDGTNWFATCFCKAFDAITITTAT